MTSRLGRAVRRIARNPAIAREAVTYALNDLGSLCGLYRYELPVIFIAGLPKSGTTWLETQLVRVPGYNLRPVHDPRGVAREHDVSDEIFDALPQSRYSVIKLHTRYSEENLRVIRAHVARFLVTIRDLRDMCISGYFHVKSDPDHPHHALYAGMSAEDSLMHRIEVTAEYVTWVDDWVRVGAADPEHILLVRFEELHADPYATFRRVFEFFRLPLDEALLRELQQSRLSGERDLAGELHGGGLRTRSTARKGIVGDWRNHFTPAHKQRFKEIAGDLLIRCGYESGLEW